MTKTINWMETLGNHFEIKRNAFPEEKLLILFDIDGTILDLRFMILYVLKSFDKKFNHDYFENLKLADITTHENRIKGFLVKFGIPENKRTQILEWYLRKRWSPEFIFEAHRPFTGVMEVVRWFQMQPNTYVGLNTGRPEAIREETLRSLNAIGKEYKVVLYPV